MHGRLVDSTPMEGGGLTVIRAKAHWWSAESNVLDVSSQDSSDGRHHSGPLVIDPVCSRLATRILIYDAPTPDEVVEQRIIISHDSKTLYVFYVLATFGLPAYRLAHVLCKVEGSDIMVNRGNTHTWLLLECSRWASLYCRGSGNSGLQVRSDFSRHVPQNDRGRPDSLPSAGLLLR